MKWISQPPVSPSSSLYQFVAGHPLVTETLFRRGFTTKPAIEAFLNPAKYTPTPPSELPDLDLALTIILDALEKQERIGIWGDFDVDGQTSTTLLVSAFQNLNADVIHYIPVRGKESHGISKEPLQDMLNNGMQLLITCDTGVKEHELIQMTRDQGCRVIITDHHDLPEQLPNAHAVINSERVPHNHPLHTLPGVGVAYKLIEALYTHLGKQEQLPQFLDLVALGIVVDVAVQTNDTRYLLQKGLQQLRTTPRMALNTIYDLANIHKSLINEVDIGFQIGPRMNSVGRLDDTNKMVNFLTSSDKTIVESIANDIERINATRKHHKEQVLAGALNQIEANPHFLDYPVLVVAQEGWKGGIVGLVASSLTEKFERPSIVLSKNSAAGIASGSARSIEQVNISQAVDACSDLLLGYGGHPMAAGMSMPIENIDEFRERIGAFVSTATQGISLDQQLTIDHTLTLPELTIPFVQDIYRLSPFGQGNPELIFRTNNLKLRTRTRIGKNKEHLKLVVEDPDHNTQEVFYWFGANQPLPEKDTYFDLTYTIAQSFFNNRLSVQVTWKDSQPSEDILITQATQKQQLHIEDYRQIVNPSQHLSTILANHPTAQIWAEAEQKTLLPNAVDRNHIQENDTLLIYTTPSDRVTLQEVLTQAQPKTILCYHMPPQAYTLNDFLNRLGGLLKNSLNTNQGQIDYDFLAAATAQSTAAIHHGLLWFQAKSIFNLISQEDHFFIERATFPIQDPQAPQQLAKELNQILLETHKFRTYYQTANLDKLLTYYE